jgi:hypothetical protein
MSNGKLFPLALVFMTLIHFPGFAAPSADSAAKAVLRVSLGKNNEVMVDGKPFFPIMQWQQRVSGIAGQKELGINTFVGQGDDATALELCEQAREQGVYAVPFWDPQQVESVKDNPALLGWVFGDEPDNQSHQVPPSRLRAQYRARRAQDPDHLSFLTITSSFSSLETLPAWLSGSHAFYYEYPHATDMIGFDLYPVYGWCRPDWIYKVGQEQRELIATYARSGTGTYQWIECVRTSSKWCSNASRGDDDGPFDYEVEDEVWLAIANGASAIGYFTHSWRCPDYSQCCLNASLTAMLTKINRQITALTPVLCAAETPLGVGLHTDDPNGRIVTRAKTYNGSAYLIAVMVIGLPGARERQQAVFSIPALKKKVAVYGEHRFVNQIAGTFIDTFSIHAPVHVYILPAR